MEAEMEEQTELSSVEVLVHEVSSILAVPSNRRFVLDATGGITFETVRSMLDFVLWTMKNGRAGEAAVAGNGSWVAGKKEEEVEWVEARQREAVGNGAEGGGAMRTCCGGEWELTCEQMEEGGSGAGDGNDGGGRMADELRWEPGQWLGELKEVAQAR